MKKVICVNRRPKSGAWGGGNQFLKHFYLVARAQGYVVQNGLTKDVSTIFIMDPRPAHGELDIGQMVEFKQTHPHVRLVHRVNECNLKRDPIIEVDQLLRLTSKYTDKTVFVSDWMKNYHHRYGWYCKDNTVIHNGVDKELFCPRTKSESDVVRIVTHHWSDNKNKSQGYHQWLDEFVGRSRGFSYTFIGRTKDELPNSTVLSPMSHQDLAKELPKYDVYVNGSAYDPYPNSCLEALACGVPTYTHINGGGAVEAVGRDHTFSNPEQLEQILLQKDYLSNNVYLNSWEECIKEYLEIV